MLNFGCEWVRTTKHAPRGPCQILEHIYGLAEIVERGVGVLVERPRVKPPHPDRSLMILFEDTSRDGESYEVVAADEDEVEEEDDEEDDDDDVK